MTNIPDKIVEKEGMCCVRYTFSENRAGYEIMWKNNVESDRQQHGACALHAAYLMLQTPTQNK
jgi:hypothetical protein